MWYIDHVYNDPVQANEHLDSFASWNDPTKWSLGSVPVIADDVVINAKLTIPVGAAMNSLEITADSVVTVAGPGSITVAGGSVVLGSGSTLEIVGSISTIAATLDVNGPSAMVDVDDSTGGTHQPFLGASSVGIRGRIDFNGDVEVPSALNLFSGARVYIPAASDTLLVNPSDFIAFRITGNDVGIVEGSGTLEIQNQKSMIVGTGAGSTGALELRGSIKLDRNPAIQRPVRPSRVTARFDVRAHPRRSTCAGLDRRRPRS